MEREPKALSLHELKYAREAALYVLRTHSSEDAVRIFTQGLKPVVGVRKNDSVDDDDYEEEDEDDMFDPDAFHDDEQSVLRGSHRCGRAGAAEGRDVATAPF